MSTIINSKSFVNFRYRVRDKAPLAGCVSATIFVTAFLINYYSLNPGQTDIARFLNTQEIQIGIGVASGIVLIALLSYGTFGKKMRREDEKDAAEAAIRVSHAKALMDKDLDHQLKITSEKAALADTFNRSVESITKEKTEIQAAHRVTQTALATANAALQSARDDRTADRAVHEAALAAKQQELRDLQNKFRLDLNANGSNLRDARAEITALRAQIEALKGAETSTDASKPSSSRTCETSSDPVISKSSSSRACF